MMGMAALVAAVEGLGEYLSDVLATYVGSSMLTTSTGLSVDRVVVHAVVLLGFLGILAIPVGLALRLVEELMWPIWHLLMDEDEDEDEDEPGPQ